LGLDRFNQINDNLGHTVGDLLLKAVAERLTLVLKQGYSCSLKYRSICHYPWQCRAQKRGGNIAQTILEKLSQTFVLAGQEIFITASIGIAFIPVMARKLNSCWRHANTAMTQAKQQGGDQYQFYTQPLILAPQTASPCRVVCVMP
jgi:GGDEF domain-containing protein